MHAFTLTSGQVAVSFLQFLFGISDGGNPNSQDSLVQDSWATRIESVVIVRVIGVRVKSVRVICVRVPDQGGACDAMEPATANSFTLQNINWLQNALLVGTILYQIDVMCGRDGFNLWLCHCVGLAENTVD